jgi:AmmeMemoRadiSam system protein A
MDTLPLTTQEKATLLHEARQTIELTLAGKLLPPLILSTYTQPLQDKCACFVTLTFNGELRGCIGTLEAFQPLIADVRDHAIDAAFKDYRFPPVQIPELKQILIEISRLTPPQPLEYKDPRELPRKLKKGVDGVILKDGFQRATFLPQVWEQLPNAEEFLRHLCMKMGAPSNLWKEKKLEVSIYHVEEFHE